MNAPERIAPEPGVYYGMPGEEYHAIEAMSASGAKKILRSPLHYKLQRDQPSEPTPSMQFGTAVHCGVLEPERFDSLVICPPKDAPKRPTSAQLNAKKPSPESLEAIAWWQNFNRECIGRLVLTAEDHARAWRCIEAVRVHPAARELLRDAQTEVSLFWEDGRYKVPCKCRWDIFSHGGVTDLKTTEDASPEGFARQCANLQYHMQGAHYLSGGEHVRDESPRFFAIIAVETGEPHAVACYFLPGDAILAGAHLMSKALERYVEIRRTGTFPGYPETIEKLVLPKWATRFNDQ